MEGTLVVGELMRRQAITNNHPIIGVTPTPAPNITTSLGALQHRNDDMHVHENSLPPETRILYPEF